MNLALKKLFDDDQEDCLNQPRDGSPDHLAFRQRIQDRISQAQTILKEEGPLSGEDYFHACLVMIHSDRIEDLWQAYQSGLKSIEKGFDKAKKFTAAAYDKWLMYQGKPQKYGLQIVPDGQCLRLWDVDPSTTDDERAKWSVPSLQELHKNASAASEQFDMSKVDMELKPQWLKDAVKRWHSGQD